MEPEVREGARAARFRGSRDTSRVGGDTGDVVLLEERIGLRIEPAGVSPLAGNRYCPIAKLLEEAADDYCVEA